MLWRLLTCLALSICCVTAIACGASQGRGESPASESGVVPTCPVELIPDLMAGPLGTLFPRDPDSAPPDCLLSDEAGNFGPFGSEFEEYERLGWVCSCDGAGHEAGRGSFSVHIDLYHTTAGAHEAYAREAVDVQDPRNKEVKGLDEALLADLGDERVIKQKFYAGDVILLMRRRNVVASMRLTQEASVDLLEYAAQLDENIQAAANAATPPQ